MKAIRRCLIVVLILVMSIAMLTLIASATDTTGVCGKYGSNVRWTLSSTGTLTISGSGNMGDYSADNRPPWYAQRENILKVDISSGVTNVGDHVFADCSNLNTVLLPSGITEIGVEAFEDCISLRTIKIPSSVTVIDSDAFIGAGLRQINIPASVTTIKNSAFRECTNLESVIIPYKLTTLRDGVFAECPKLKTAGPIGGDYNIQFGWTTTIPACAFSLSNYLTTVTIPEGITAVGDAAFYSTALSSVIYLNTEAQWDKISFPSSFDVIDKSIVTFCPASLKSAPIVTGSINTTTGQPKLTWTKLNGATKYQIYRATSKNGYYWWMYNTTSTDYTNTTADSGTTYYYKVRAMYADGSYSPYSSVVTVTCTEAIPRPQVTGSHYESTGQPRLTWDALSNAAKYEIYRSKSHSGTYYLMYTTTGTRYTNTTATAGNTYYYKVRAIMKDGAVSPYSDVVSLTCLHPAPQVTGSTNTSTGQPKLTWPAISGAVKYEIYRARSYDGQYWWMYNTTGTSYTNTTAEFGETYYYKVRAVFKDGSYSPFSSVVTRTSDYPTPIITVSNDPVTGAPLIQWKTTEGARCYQIHRSTSKDGGHEWLGNTTTDSYIDTTAVPGETYYYMMRLTYDMFTSSPFSARVSRTCDYAQPKVTGSYNSSGLPKLSWEKVEGATTYKVYRSNTKNGTYGLMYTTTGLNYINTTAVSGKTYYYKVQAIGSSNYATSAYSNIITLTCK